MSNETGLTADTVITGNTADTDRSAGRPVTTGHAGRKTPSIKVMEKWMLDGVARATDGCRVEPDGVCPHGKNSWLIELGFM